MTSNRNPVKRWFATYPESCQAFATKESFAEAFPPKEFYSCCEEDHVSGKKHLHACVLLKKPLSKCKLLKYLEKTYPNDIKRLHLRPVRDLDNALDYIKKEDPEYFTIGSIPGRGPYSKEMLKIEEWFISNGYWSKNHREEAEKAILEDAERKEKYRQMDLEFKWMYTND